MFSTAVAYVALGLSSTFILVVIACAVNEMFDPMRELRNLMDQMHGRRRTFWTRKLAVAITAFLVSGIYLFG